jgi:hypothetical protein
MGIFLFFQIVTCTIARVNAPLGNTFYDSAVAKTIKIRIKHKIFPAYFIVLFGIGFCVIK